MRGGRIAPHAARNTPVRARQQQQVQFLRSQTALSGQARENMRALSAAHLKALMARAHPAAPLEPGPRQRAAEAIFKMMKDIVKKQAPRMNEALKQHLAGDAAKQEHQGRIATGLGLVRDADGHVIYLDDRDRPYVRVDGGQVLYVKVYAARITPNGRNLDAKCTIDSPDGKQEVLLVEPMPSISAVGDGS